MNTIRRIRFMVLAVVVGCLLAGGVFVRPSSADRGQDIIDNMNSMPKTDSTISLTTLANAINKAGLGGTLKGTGPYTFFAPTDAAFKKLPSAKWDAVSNDPAKLKAFLLGLVVKGAMTKADFTNGKKLQNLAGGALEVKNLGGGAIIGGATILRMDGTEASNGIIYVLDAVPASLLGT